MPVVVKITRVTVRDYDSDPHEFFFDECIEIGDSSTCLWQVWGGVCCFSHGIYGSKKNAVIFSTALLKSWVWKYWDTGRVPVNPDGIGPTALSVEPEIEQVFIACPDISMIQTISKENYLSFAIMQAIPLATPFEKMPSVSISLPYHIKRSFTKDN